nr:hypothetical protein [Mucilaginibacter sp. SP1R1]
MIYRANTLYYIIVDIRLIEQPNNHVLIFENEYNQVESDKCMGGIFCYKYVIIYRKCLLTW